MVMVEYLLPKVRDLGYEVVSYVEKPQYFKMKLRDASGFEFSHEYEPGQPMTEAISAEWWEKLTTGKHLVPQTP